MRLALNTAEKNPIASASMARELNPTVACPECGRPAIVAWRSIVQSTDGPVELVKITCPRRHWFLMPTDGLAV